MKYVNNLVIGTNNLFVRVHKTMEWTLGRNVLKNLLKILFQLQDSTGRCPALLSVDGCLLGVVGDV